MRGIPIGSRSVLRVACVCLALAAVTACEQGRQPDPSDPPPGSPSARDTYISTTTEALDTVIRESQRVPQKPLQFGANLWFAHEAWIERVPGSTLEFYVDALRDAGVHRIDINTGLFPWLTPGTQRADETIAKYDAAIRRIRDWRLQLVFNPQYSPTYHRLSSFDELTQRSLFVYEQLARRYQPDIFIVVHEPTTMARRLGVTVSPQEWANFARTAAQTVRRVSPRTRIGAGGLHSEIDYYRAFAALPELDVLTLDIYELSALPVYTDMAAIARDSGKAVYIEETWRTPFSPPSFNDNPDSISLRGVGDEVFKALDAKWLEAITLYAGALGLEAITAVWTPTFFKYVGEGRGNALDSAYVSETVQAIDNGERTDTFFAFASLIRRSVPVPLGTATDSSDEKLLQLEEQLPAYER